jgi:hypothetical protein
MDPMLKKRDKDLELTGRNKIFALLTTASFAPFIILCPFQVTMAVLY